MRKIWLFCVLGIFLTTCTLQVKEYPVIKDPNYPRVVVREKQGKVVKDKKVEAIKEEKIQIGTFYPDPTRILVGNQTYNIFIKVWLDPSFEKGRVKGPPDFDLPPNVKVEATMPLGKHQVYTKGRIKTREYGWQSVGAVSKDIFIDSRVYYGSGYGDYAIFYQGDFPR